MDVGGRGGVLATETGAVVRDRNLWLRGVDEVKSFGKGRKCGAGGVTVNIRGRPVRYN